VFKLLLSFKESGEQLDSSSRHDLDLVLVLHPVQGAGRGLAGNLDAVCDTFVREG
jgi:hypothetical protein